MNEAITKRIPQEIKNKIVGEANWRSTNGHGGVDDITRDNFILAAEFGYSLATAEYLRSEQVMENIREGIIRLEDLSKYHIAPYNLGDMGEVLTTIRTLSKLLNSDTNDERSVANTPNSSNDADNQK